MDNNNHIVGIECRNCHQQWKITVPLTGSKIEVFATMCDCGAIIVGNYNTSISEESKGTKITGESISNDEKYLSNGHFDFLLLSEEELEKLPELNLE